MSKNLLEVTASLSGSQQRFRLYGIAVSVATGKMVPCDHYNTYLPVFQTIFQQNEGQKSSKSQDSEDLSDLQNVVLIEGNSCSFADAWYHRQILTAPTYYHHKLPKMRFLHFGKSRYLHSTSWRDLRGGRSAIFHIITHRIIPLNRHPAAQNHREDIGKCLHLLC